MQARVPCILYFYARPLAALILLLALAGCETMRTDSIARNCNTDAAHAAGVNAGKQGSDMIPNYGSRYSCPEQHTALNAAYRDGYKFGLENAAKTAGRNKGYRCYNSFGKEICGYNCVEAITSVQCAPTPDQHCMATDFGSIACGYGCAKSGNTVKCASNKRENCVADVFGNVICGRNCRIDFNKAKCDEQRDS
ncbi:MAG: hypothetical protein AAF699_09190 [Pseudomonadota bacterium]